MLHKILCMSFSILLLLTSFQITMENAIGGEGIHSNILIWHILWNLHDGSFPRMPFECAINIIGCALLICAVHIRKNQFDSSGRTKPPYKICKKMNNCNQPDCNQYKKRNPNDFSVLQVLGRKNGQVLCVSYAFS